MVDRNRKRHLLWVITGIALLASLFTGPVALGAQTPPDLSEVFTWQPYGLSVRYPAGWVAVTKDNLTSLHPADRDVSDGLGPELVLFILPGVTADQIDTATQGVIAGVSGTADPVKKGTLEGRTTRAVTFQQADPAATGGVTLVAADAHTVLGLAYIVRATQAPQFLPVLRAMLTSATFNPVAASGPSEAGVRPTAPGDTATVSTSASVASVQLAQSFSWEAAGLALYFPTGWTISEEQDGEQAIVVVEPDDPASVGPGKVYLIHASTLPWFPGIDLDELATLTAQQPVLETTDVTVAGYSGVVYDLVDSNGRSVLHLRTLLLAVEDRATTVMIIFGADEAGWDSFRPQVDAMIGSIEPLTGPRSLDVFGAAGAPVALAATDPSGPPFPPRQNDPLQLYVWEEFGVTIVMPDGWQPITTAQQYDLALVSPEALQGQDDGAFIGFQYIVTLGSSADLKSVLAEQIGGDVSDYAAAERTGAQIIQTDSTTGAIQHLILLPYDPDAGDAFFIVTRAAPEVDETLLAALDTLTIEPVKPDMAAIDAAWQASLADSSTLAYGDPAAPVKMLEFLDLSCGHCASYSADVARLMALEVETGRLWIEFSLLDIIGGQLSNQAAQATYCATEQGKGYTAYHILLQGYMTLGYQAAYSPEGITDLLSAPEIGLDIDALNACIDAGTYAGLLNENKTRSDDMGVTGTPSVLLAVGDDLPQFLTLPDGQQWSGGVPPSFLRQIINKVITEDASLDEALQALFG